MTLQPEAKRSGIIVIDQKENTSNNCPSLMNEADREIKREIN